MNNLILIADTKNTDKVLDFINEELEMYNFPDDLLPDINVAVEEIFVNIASYAYQPDTGYASISITVGNEAVIRIEDTVIPFNPLEQPTPDMDIPLMEREIGGLGIYFARKLMDEVLYKYEDNKNVLTLIKRRERL